MMSAFTGKPGAGKSYGAMLEILEELQRGSRIVVTNMAVLLDECNVYFQQSGREFVDVYSRVRLLTREEAKEFWRFRGNFTLRAPCNVVSNPVSVLADMPNVPGVFYVLDEAHLLFDARTWAKSSEYLTFYNSQHRKLGDDVVFVTQHLKLMETRVRVFVEKFHVFRNFVGAKALQILSMPPRMREMVYSTEPGQGVEPDYEIWRRLDLTKARLYDTTGGVGMAGGRKPEPRKTKGFSLPWWSVLVVLAGLGFGIWYGSRQIPRLLLGGLNGAAAHVMPLQSSSVAPTGVSSSSPVSQPSSAVETSPLPANQAPRVFMTGSLLRGKDIMVTLSDGRILRAPDLARVDSDKAIDREGRVYWRELPSRAKTPPSTGR